MKKIINVNIEILIIKQEHFLSQGEILMKIKSLNTMMWILLQILIIIFQIVLGQNLGYQKIDYFIIFYFIYLFIYLIYLFYLQLIFIVLANSRLSILLIRINVYM